MPITALLLLSSLTGAPALAADAPMQVVFLGTGTPVPDPERQGPSLAVIAGGHAYLVDAGTGVVRQAQAAYKRGIVPLAVAELDTAFLTHLHSDHTLGLADLILTPWVMHRPGPLRLYGPTGTKAMVAGLLQAYGEDIHMRLTGGEGANSTGHDVDVHEIRPGEAMHGSAVSVTAFPVSHGDWAQAYGYRFEAGGKSVVISGDTRPAESVVKACAGCDLLVHEAYSGQGGSPSGANGADAWMDYMHRFHTSGVELGQLAARAGAKRLVVTHYIALGGTGEADLLREIRQHYSGPVSLARDLDVVTP